VEGKETVGRTKIYRV